RVSDMDLYFSEQYQLVYLPPHFRARIFAFIFFIWMFAAFTGVGLTIVPLMVGRMLFRCMLPSHVRTNDIYAFSIGIYVLGGAAYSALRMRSVAGRVGDWVAAGRDALLGRGAVTQVSMFALQVAQFAYAYFNIFVFFPLLASTLVELYLLIPIHTYF